MILRTREYQTMTLRELYNYVLKAIATRPDGLPQSTHNFMRATVEPSKVPIVLDVRQRPFDSVVSSLGSGREPATSTIGDNADEDDSSNDENNTKDQEEEENPKEREGRKKVTFEAPPPITTRGRSSSFGLAPSSAENVTYRERLGGYLHPRDMRRLVTPFSTTNAPELMVRRHVILLNCDPLRAIVLRDRLLVLVPDGADSILETISKRIIGGREEMEDSVFGSRHDEPSMQKPSTHSKHKKFLGRGTKSKTKDETKRSESTVSNVSDATSEDNDEDTVGDEWHDLEGRAWIDMPFELKAVDAVLHTVAVMLAEDVEILQEAVYDTIDDSLKGKTGVGDYNQQVLRALKNEIKEMSSRVDNFVRAINDSLDDLEDLSLMNLSRLLTHPERFIQPVPEEVLNEESDEPELILEVYLQQALSIFNQLDLLSGQVVTSEELIAMQLDTVRNRLLYINAVVSVFTLTVTLAALVGSIYGMNVINGREEDPVAFKKIVSGTSLGCLVVLCSLLYTFWGALRLPSVHQG